MASSLFHTPGFVASCSPPRRTGRPDTPCLTIGFPIPLYSPSRVCHGRGIPSTVRLLRHTSSSFGYLPRSKLRFPTAAAAAASENGGPLTEVLDAPMLSGSEVVERLKAKAKNRTGNQLYTAMYSSFFGGIATDPAAMVISMDDHMVHRGHGVFDTAAVVNGYLYELDQHLDRFLKSASMAKIAPPFGRAEMRSILIKTVSASQTKKGSLRYWLSAGPGDFFLSPSGCPSSVLYAVVMEDKFPFDKHGVKVITSSVPMKPALFSTMKNVNYLPNVLSKMEAEENGAYAAIWIDDDGYVAEGPNMNVAFVTTENVFVMPRFDKVLSGCTAIRVMALAEKLVKSGVLSAIEVNNVTAQEGKRSQEMMLLGSGVLVKPVLQWDDRVIGDGKEGPVSEALLSLLLEDMTSGPAEVRTLIPY